MSVYLSAFCWLARGSTWVAGGKNLKLEKFGVEVEEEKKKTVFDRSREARGEMS